jgi:hypothetical protein
MDTVLQDLHPLDQGVLECLDSVTGRAKQCAKSALVHLEKAQRIAALDAEMAIFRAITAEEEAATSLFFAVKQLGYANAERLRHRDHVHKNALIPFLFAVKHHIDGSTPTLRTNLVLKTNDGKKRLTIELQMPDGRWGEPVPPLNFSIVGDVDGRRARFGREINQLAKGAGKANVQKYLKDVANLRNKLLYADEKGVPAVTGNVEDNLKRAREKVFLLLRAVCLVFPYREHALFVQQALDAFLIALGAIKEGDLTW